MRRSNFHKCFLSAIAIVFFLSCTQRPELNESWIPAITDVKAQVDINEVVLSAEISSEHVRNIECGFLYGRPAGTMISAASKISGKEFRVKIQDLEYDSEYVYKAFISNGHNKIESRLFSFKTEAEPYLHVSQTSKSVPSSETEFSVEVQGNTEFEVIIPEETDWVGCSREDRICTFKISENNDASPRMCNVVFSAVMHDFKVILKITQDGRKETQVVSSTDVELRYDETEFSVETEAVDKITSQTYIPEGVDWVRFYYGVNAKYVFSVDENTSSEPRSTEIQIIDSEGRVYRINLTQKGKPSETEEYTLELPYAEEDVGYEQSEFSVEVGGNAEFEVIVVNAGWIQYKLEDRKCIFTVSQNTEPQQRSTFVVFNSLSHQCALSFEIRQFPAPGADLELQYDKVVLQYHQTSVRVQYKGGMSGYYDSIMAVGKDEWACVGYAQATGNLPWDGDLLVKCDENPSYEERTCVALIEDEKGGQYPLTIVQKAWCSIMEFEDPEMEQACVEAFDTDGDGKLSFYEAASVKDMSRLDLEGKNITSFAEFAYFTNTTALPDGLFAGSGIKKISFPSYAESYGAILSGRRTFMNCTELTDGYMGTLFHVQDQAFMGCTGLKNVYANIKGESAFEGCTGLETVVQRDNNSIPKRAFKNCISLSYIKFPPQTDYFADKKIGEEAFFGCTSLASVTLPEWLVAIDDRAFANCSNLTSVYIESRSIPTLGTDVFAGTSSELKIYVHPQQVSQYKSSWSSLSDRIFPIEL